MNRLAAVSSASLILCAVFTLSAYGQEASEVHKTAIVATISEAALASAALIQDAGGGTIKELSFEGRYSRRDWIIQAKGTLDDRSINMTMTGFLWGDEKTDLSVNYSGLGRLGKEPLRIHGASEWLFDTSLSDYQNVDVQHVMKFGDNSLWGWVVAGETVFGGAVGGGAAIVASPATGGASLLIGAAAAIAGANATVLLSKNVREVVESDEPTAPPQTPERPEPPETNKTFPLSEVSEDTILIAVSKDRTIIGKGPSTKLLLSGDYSHDDGVYKANIKPE